MSSDLPPIDPPATGGKPSRSPVWMRALLVVSLALNLAVVGLVVGFAAKGGPHRGPSGSQAAMDFGLGPVGRAFTEDDRDALKTIARERRAEAREVTRALRRSFRDLVPLLRAETLDEAAVLAVFDQQRTAAEGRHRLAHDVLWTYVSGLPVADRRALADRLERAVKRRGPKKGQGGKPRKGDD